MTAADSAAELTEEQIDAFCGDFGDQEIRQITQLNLRRVCAQAKRAIPRQNGELVRLLEWLESIVALYDGDIDDLDAHDNARRQFALQVIERIEAAALQSIPAAGEPVAVTQEMIAAYLTANDAYWRATDEQPKKLGKWRNGTPSEATRVSLIAALAAAPAASVERDAAKGEGK